MKALLPEDGTPVLNRVMRVMLARKLEHPIDEDLFFKARDALLDAGTLGRLRGQGGQMFLLKSEKTGQPEPEDKTDEAWSERKLMTPLKAFLDGPFRKGLDLPDKAAFIVQDTSVLGPQKGRWARPDFIAISAMRFKLLPGAQVDLHSFELKTQVGGSVLAIHEALAQTRFTHFGHLVWHLPDGSKAEPLLDDITSHCGEHGVGLIRMRDPTKAGDDGCEILVDPKRKPTLPAIIDGFLESRLSKQQKEMLLGFVGANG